MRPRPLLALLFVLLGACGRDPLDYGDGGVGAGGGGRGGATGAGGSAGSAPAAPQFLSGAYCQRDANRRANCNLQPDTDCQQLATCYGRLFRAEAQDAVAICLSTRKCNDNDDACFDQGAAPYLKTAAFLRFREACSKKILSCGGSANDVRENCPDVLAIATDDLLASLLSCTTVGCASVQECVSRVAGCN